MTLNNSPKRLTAYGNTQVQTAHMQGGAEKHICCWNGINGECTTCGKQPLQAAEKQ